MANIFGTFPLRSRGGNPIKGKTTLGSILHNHITFQMTAVVSNVSLHFWDSIDFSQVSEAEATVFLLEIEI